MRGGDRIIGALAAFSGAIAVAAGAFAAHGASGRAAELLRTGAHYQLVHAVAAIAVLALAGSRAVAWLFVAGGALFAGTLYAMAFGAPNWFGAITPIGGAGLIAGWAWLGVGLLRR
ncbi:DUF423 domain-containing protein [Flavisphingomonas formosensis]|uniref:DUF423 domain-containing protein n=1 Tax=Flavisphingomonas formosensis TaxID=861534 RepID=UPI0012FBC3DD|nr:DUF423 domain-containing protein [Sphingomonas formosensis]